MSRDIAYQGYQGSECVCRDKMGAGIRICPEYWLGNGFNAQGLGFDYKIIQNGIELEFRSKQDAC